MSNFIEQCINGDRLLDEIDEGIAEWHEGDLDVPLYRYLGMTKGEYSLWLSEPGLLPFIVDAHRRGMSVEDVIGELNALPMAARAESPEKAIELVDWLKKKGFWE